MEIVALATTSINTSQEIDQISNAFTTSVVDGEKAAASAATTTFVTDANVVATTIPRPVYTPRSLYMAASDNYMQEIKTYLQKPQLVSTGVFSSTDTVSSFAASAISFPYFYSTIPMWVEKVRGYFGIRFDLSFRLVVNATRFQQGRYLLLWKPFGGADAASAKNLAIMSGHVMTLVQRTQMPHAEIDINCDTEIEFKIPFSNQYNFCHIRSITSGNQYNSLGTIQIYPYVAVNAIAGALTCSYSLYVSAENIELISAAVPQSSRFITNTRKKNESNAEQDSQNMGPISSIMAKVSNATSILSGVPLISSYASGVSWLSDTIGRTAAVFGYSRPINLEHANRMDKVIFPYLASTDGPDNSVPLALSYKNELGSLQGFSPTDLDEMDFSFLCTIPTWDRTIPWNVGTAAGTALASFGVGPRGTADNTVVVNALSLYSVPPYRYVASHFKFWRGTMVYKFKIVKTEFHSGRLSFSFTPETTSQAPLFTPTAANLPYIHREIVDIRLDNEVTFKVPFVSDTPWKPVQFVNDEVHLTGIFSIHIVDPLVAPDTVPQTVSIILEISMGPDVEFAVPYGVSARMPYYGAAPQMSSINASSKPEPNVCNEITTDIGASSSIDDQHNSALLCIGEKITNFRRFIRRATPILFNTSLNGTPGPFMNVVPYLTPAITQNGVANATPNNSSDMYTSISSLYLYSRGSVRLKFVNANVLESSAGETAGTVGYFSPKWLYRLKTEDPIIPLTNLVTWSGAGVAYSSFDVNLAQLVLSGKENQEIQVPHYHRMPIRNNFDHVANSQYPYSTHAASNSGAATALYVQRLLVQQSNSTQDSVPTRVYRSTADDCSFGYFLSVPPYVDYSTDF
jgi:hypothetical protein